MIAALAGAATVALALSYWCMSKTGNMRQFHWTNALTAPVLIATAIIGGSWMNAPVSLLFGSVAAYGLWKGRKNG